MTITSALLGTVELKLSKCINDTWPVQLFPTHSSCKLCCFPTQLECNFVVLGGKMTVYNCGPIYYTVCLSCLKISLHVPSLLYHIGLCFFVLVIFLCMFILISNLNYLAAYFSFLIKITSLF